jgi:23S rRNA pseudouridine1911/1915/1917 synthase
MPFFSCTVEDSIPGDLRLDRYIAEYLKILSRSQIKARKLEARLNGKPVKISRVLKAGDHLELSWLELESPFLIPQNLTLEIIYEDKNVIVVNKVQGMVVHPGAGNRQGTLANALLYRGLGIQGFGTRDLGTGISTQQLIPCPHFRPGIVHRLDKDTSGLMIAAWDDETHAFLSEQFKERRVRKTYAAFVQGCPKEKFGCIEKNIIRSARDRKTFTVSDKGGRPSLTYFRLVRSWGNHSLLLLRPKTGRTHQLRVHLKYLGHPILGDPIYGRDDLLFPKASLMLHAKSLSLVLPGQKEAQKFRTVLPERFKEVIRILNRGKK